MKKSFLYSLVLSLFVLTAAPQAQAGWLSKWFWFGEDFTPYLNDATLTHPKQWRAETWTVTDWAPTPALGRSRLDELFQAKVFEDYRAESWLLSDNTLFVGEGFYHLSGYDQGRVVTLFDYVYHATKQPQSTLLLKDDYTGKTIGYYTRQGLYLQ